MKFAGSGLGSSPSKVFLTKDQQTPTQFQVFTLICADGNMYGWDVITRQILYKIQVEPEHKSVFGITISPDDKKAVVSTVLGTIKIACLINKEICASFRGHSESVEDICYSPSGKLFTSCAKDGKIKLWEDIELACRSSRRCEGHVHWVYACNFSAGEALVISASADKTIKLWSVESCECLKTFVGHKNIVWSVHFWDDEASTIVSCSSDGTVRYSNVFSYSNCLPNLDR